MCAADNMTRDVLAVYEGAVDRVRALAAAEGIDLPPKPIPVAWFLKNAGYFGIQEADADALVAAHLHPPVGVEPREA